jgi:hypothetical protein
MLIILILTSSLPHPHNPHLILTLILSTGGGDRWLHDLHGTVPIEFLPQSGLGRPLPTASRPGAETEEAAVATAGTAEVAAMVAARVMQFGEETRVDASDGRRYTKESFIQVYGGTVEWAAARR